MRNVRKLLVARSLTLLFATFLVALVLIYNLFPDSTHAINATQNEPESTNPDEADRSDSATLANCRYGSSASPSEAHILPTIGAGVFYDWRVDWPYPMPANDAEFLHMIRPRQRKTATGEYLPEWYSAVKLDGELADLVSSDPGAIWIIGNEPERGPNPGKTYSARTDDIHADMYAEAYHDIYHFIKGIDPTARITNAGLIQITPMRLQYLDLMWDAYVSKYGVPMPVDVWTIHAYVMPELTPDGQPNNIASAALGTDLAHGKRASGGDVAKCSDPDVYCYAEHDDPALLEEQIIAMRQWMKDHGQQVKPLIVTEYSTLYHYIVNEDSSCSGLRDENGECFTPQRVSKFMIDTFDYFNSAQDPALGMPADNNKLVQQWIWYDAHAWDIGSSNLLKNDKLTLNQIGKTFRNYVVAEPTSVNLVVDSTSASVVSYDQNNVAKAKLSVQMRNNGNISIKKPFTVTFYRNAALTQSIGSVTVTPDIRGCAARAYKAEVEWNDLAKGTHQFWVKLDRTNAITEQNEADNIGSGQLDVTGPVYGLDVQIISDGEGVGGSVSAEPPGQVHPEGTKITLTAIPSTGWSFQKWSGALIGNSPQVSITVNEDTSISAHFVQDHYVLTLNKSGEGDVTINPEKDYFLYGEKVKLDAVASPGWQFVKWRGDIEDVASQIEHSFDDDLTITAVFKESIPIDAYNIFNPVIMGES